MGRQPNNIRGKPGRYKGIPARGCSPPLENRCAHLTGSPPILTQQTPDCDDTIAFIDFSADIYPTQSGESSRFVTWGVVTSTSYHEEGSGHCCDVEITNFPGQYYVTHGQHDSNMTGTLSVLADCNSQSLGYRIDITRSGALEDYVVIGHTCFYWDCNGFQTTDPVFADSQSSFGYPCACPDTSHIFASQAPNQLIVDYTYDNDVPILNWDDSVFAYSCEVKEGEQLEVFSGVFVDFDMNLTRQDSIILSNEEMGGCEGFGDECDKCLTTQNYYGGTFFDSDYYYNHAQFDLSLLPNGLLNINVNGGYGGDGGNVTDKDGNQYYVGKGCNGSTGICPASCNDNVTVLIDPTGDNDNCCLASITFTWSHA